MAGNNKHAESSNIMVDDLFIRDPLFKKGFYAGFSGKKIVNDDFNEELHPRDDDGKFTFGEGTGSSSSGSSASESKAQEEPGSNTTKVTTRAEADARLASLFKEVQPGFNVSDEHAISIANALTKLNDEFGVINPENASLEGFSGQEDYKYTRAMSRGDPGLGIARLSYSAKYFKDMPMEEFLRKAKNETMGDRYHMPCDTENREELMSYITHHEYGHLVENSLIKEKAAKSKVLRELKEETDAYYGGVETPLIVHKKVREYDRMSRVHQREIVKIAQKNNPDFNLRSQISQYGRTSPREFFAECFANSQLSKPNELGIAMQEFLKKHKIGKSNQPAPKKKN